MNNNKNKNVVIFENRKTPMARVVNESSGFSSETKDYIFEGVCAVFEGKNNNSRYYDRAEYLRLIEALQPEIEQNSLAGSLDHPDDEDDGEKDIFTPKMKDLSHLITKLWYKPETDEVWVRIKLLDTEWGKSAKACVDAGMPLYISSRASGFIDQDGRVWLSQIHTYDIVYRPGFKDAKLNPVLESYDGKNSCFSVISRCSVNENEEMNEPIIMENQKNKIYKLSELTKSDVLDIISLYTPESAEFTWSVVNILPELYDYPKFTEFLVDEDGDEKPFMEAIVDYFMGYGRYVYDDTGYSCENISDFIDIEVSKACRDYFAEIKNIFSQELGSEYSVVNENTDVEKYRSIVESVSKSKKHTIKKLQSVNECSSAKAIVTDFCFHNDNDADRIDVINAFIDAYPSELDKSVFTDKELILLVMDWKNDPIYQELDYLKSVVLDLQSHINRSHLNRQDDYRLYRKSIENIVKDVNKQFSDIHGDISALYDAVDCMQQDMISLMECDGNINSGVSLMSSRIRNLESKIKTTSERLGSSIEDVRSDHVTIANQMSAMEDDMSLIAESNNKMKKQVRQQINEKKLSSAKSLASRVDDVIEKIKSSSSEFKIFESDGTLLVPNRYKKKYEALDEDQKYHITSMMENKNPRTKSEYFSIWESFGL